MLPTRDEEITISRTRTLLLARIASAGLASALFIQTMHEETVQLGPNAVEHIFSPVSRRRWISQNAPDATTDSAMLAAIVQQQAVMAAQAQQMLQQAAAMLNAPMAMPVLNAASSAAACATNMTFTQIGGEQPKMTEYRSVGCGGYAPSAPVQPAEVKPAYVLSVPAPKLIETCLAAPQDNTPNG
jgi:hypothetical protein